MCCRSSARQCTHMHARTHAHTQSGRQTRHARPHFLPTPAPFFLFPPPLPLLLAHLPSLPPLFFSCLLSPLSLLLLPVDPSPISFLSPLSPTSLTPVLVRPLPAPRLPCLCPPSKSPPCECSSLYRHPGTTASICFRKPTNQWGARTGQGKNRLVHTRSKANPIEKDY